MTGACAFPSLSCHFPNTNIHPHAQHAAEAAEAAAAQGKFWIVCSLIKRLLAMDI
jgi:protein-disulfide isomerase